MRLSAKLFLVLALAVALGLATAVSPYASANPDGLEKVAGDKGFSEQGALHSIQGDSPIADYAFPGIGDERLATGLAGFAGTLGVLTIGFALAWALRRRGDRLEGGTVAGGRAR